jgi:hypothetical protein
VVVTLEHVKGLLHHERVTQTRRRDECFPRSAPMVIFSALPEGGGLSSVDIYFNESCDVVDIVSFGHWHGHYDTAGDEDENIRHAFTAARELVKGKVHIIEQYTRNGKYLSSEGHRPGQPLPRSLRNAEYAERLAFGKPPQRLVLPADRSVELGR